MIIGLHLVYSTRLEIESYLNDKEKETFNETLDKFHIDSSIIPKFELDGTSDNK